MGDHSLSPLQEEDLLEDLNVYLCTQILGAGLHCEKEIIWIFLVVENQQISEHLCRD